MTNATNDRYVEYFTEKIWSLIPAFYRDDDGLADWPDVLRAIVGILAGPAAVLKRSNDRFWDDAFIDLCDDWAVPYIADLVGTRLVSALNPRGRRVDVAKTIYYRRRKGTVRVLEELISDIAGWEGKVVEEFRRLARAAHSLDPKPAPFAGRFTGTPPGGYADIRHPRGAVLVDSPVDEFFHYGDVRHHQGGLDGRYNIPKVAFHLYRIPAHDVGGEANAPPGKKAPFGVDPAAGPNLANGTAFSIDPSGRDIPLFQRRSRPEKFDWDQWRSAREWELPAPMRCRVLGHAEYEINEALVLDLVAQFGISPAAAAELRKLRGIRMETESALLSAINTLPSGAVFTAPDVLAEILQQGLIQDCGKSSLLPKSLRVTEGGAEVTSDQIAAGDLAHWTTHATGKRLIIEPERGRLLFLGAAPGPVKVEYNYGFPGTIGAGTYSRAASVLPPTAAVITGGGAIASAALALGTSAAPGVTQIGDSFTYRPDSVLSGIVNMVLQAQDLQRPYLRLLSDWTLTSSAGAKLTLDGLWIGASGIFSIVLDGTFEQVTLRHCTLDPGGVDAQGNTIHAVPLQIAGNIRELMIDQSITGPIALNKGELETLTVTDSILDGAPSGSAAVVLPLTSMKVRRATIFGAVTVDRLDASEVLITGLAAVANTQEGCFRFSAALEQSRVPRRYQSNLIKDVAHFFTTRRFGQPGYAQLSESAPAALQTGAESGSEIGAFSSLDNPIRLDSLKAKVDEYLPFGLIPIYIDET